MSLAIKNFWDFLNTRLGEEGLFQRFGVDFQSGRMAYPVPMNLEQAAVFEKILQEWNDLESGAVQFGPDRYYHFP